MKLKFFFYNDDNLFKLNLKRNNIMSDIKAAQSSKVVNDFLAKSVKNYETRTDSEQSIFDMSNGESGSFVDKDSLDYYSSKTGLRFDNQYWEKAGVQKVDSWREWSTSDMANLVCDKYQYEDGSYSVTYKVPYGPLTKLINGEDGEIIQIQDYDKDGNILAQSSNNPSTNWNVTTYDENNKPDISLTYSRHKTGDYTTLKDNDPTGTKQEEVNRRGNVIRHFAQDVTNVAEQLIKGPEKEISEEEYRKINNSDERDV